MESDFRCSKCDKTFTSTTTLGSHKKTHMRKKRQKNLGDPARKITQEKALCNGSISKGDSRLKQELTNEGQAKSLRRQICDKLIRHQSLRQKHKTGHFSDSCQKDSHPIHPLSHNVKCNDLSSEQRGDKNCGASLSDRLQADGSVTDRHCPDGEAAPSSSLWQAKTKISSQSKFKDKQTNLETGNGEELEKAISKTCEVCRKVFARSANVQLHMRLHRGEKPFSCSTCGKHFRRSDHLKNHELVHVRKGPYECSLCRGTFKRKDHLKYHQINSHGAKIYLSELKSYTRTAQSETCSKLILCDVCGISFGSEKNLKNHLRIHSNQGRFPCKYCRKAFNQTSNLNIHLRKHTGETPYKCFNCDQSFTTSSKLKTHARKHTGEQPFSCELCGRLFGENHLLKMHMKTHSNQKSYKCSHCGKTFTHSSTLRAHVRTHTGAKPYKCDQCGDAFAQISSLTYHKRTHSGEKPYSCHICGNSYTRMATLNIHLTRHSGQKRVCCPHCDFKCDTPKHLRKHAAKIHGHSQDAVDLILKQIHNRASDAMYTDSFIHSPTLPKISNPADVTDLCVTATQTVDQTERQLFQSSASWDNVPTNSKPGQLPALSSCTDGQVTSHQVDKTAVFIPPSSNITQEQLSASSTLNVYNQQYVYGLIVGFSDMLQHTGSTIQALAVSGPSQLQNMSVLSSTSQPQNMPSVSDLSQPQNLPALSGQSQPQNMVAVSDPSQPQNLSAVSGPSQPQNTAALSSPLIQLHNSRPGLGCSQSDFNIAGYCHTANGVPQKITSSSAYINTPTQDINTRTHISTCNINPHTYSINTCAHVNPITQLINLPTHNFNAHTQIINLPTQNINTHTQIINLPTQNINTPTQIINIPTQNINILSQSITSFQEQVASMPNSRCHEIVHCPTSKVSILPSPCLAKSQPNLEMSPQTQQGEMMKTIQVVGEPDCSTNNGSCTQSQLIQLGDDGTGRREGSREKSSSCGIGCDFSDKNDCVKNGAGDCGSSGEDKCESNKEEDCKESRTNIKEEVTVSSLILNKSKTTVLPLLKASRVIRSKIKTSDSRQTSNYYKCKPSENDKKRTKLRMTTLKSQIGSDTKCSQKLKDAAKLIKQQVKRKKRPAECHICGQTFSRTGNLTTHMRLHSGERPYSCQVCGNKYTRSDHLKTHMLLHKGDHSLVCNHCGDVFTSTHQLNLHTSDRHEGKKPFSCNLCLFSCIDLRELKEHIKGHEEKHSFNCDLCQVSFLKVKDLKKHMESHDGQSAFACHTCEKTFKESSCLKLHIMTKHTGEKRFKCGICGETYVTAAKLQRHMRNHSGARPYACEFCGKMFIDTCLLKMHVRIHTNEKPFKCKHCAQSFTHRSTLRAHVRIHTGVKPYTCEICKASFAQVSSLTYHKRRHDGVKPYTCHICGNSYTRSTTLNIHMTRHTGQKRVSCPHCVFKCDMPKHLRKHITKVHSFVGQVIDQGQGTQHQEKKVQADVHQHDQQTTVSENGHLEQQKQHQHQLHAPQILFLPQIQQHLQHGFMVAEPFQQPQCGDHQNLIIQQPQCRDHQNLIIHQPNPPVQQLQPHPALPLMPHQPVYKTTPEAYSVIATGSAEFVPRKLIFSPSTSVTQTF